MCTPVTIEAIRAFEKAQESYFRLLAVVRAEQLAELREFHRTVIDRAEKVRTSCY